MRRLVVLVAVSALVVGACKKKEAPIDPKLAAGAGKPGVAALGTATNPAAAQTPTAAATPAAAPVLAGDVLGSGAVGSIDEFVTALEPYLAAMGAGGKLTSAGIKATVGKWIGLASWDGVDGTKPVRVWFVNPKKYKPPFVIALPMMKGKTLATQGWATEAIGEYAVLAKDAATIAALRGAVTAALAQPANVTGSKLVFNLGVPELLSVYSAEIEKLLGKLGKMVAGKDSPIGGDSKKFMIWLGRGALDVARQVARVDAELNVVKDQARIVVKLQPVAGSSLAQFLAAPKQPQPASLAKLPDDVSIAAAFSYDPAMLKATVEKIAAHMESMGADKPTAMIGFLRQGVASLFDVIKGDFVYAKRVTGASMALVGVKDQAKALESFRGIYTQAAAFAEQDTGPGAIASKSELKKDAGSVKGMKYDRVRTSFDYSKLEGMQRTIMEKIQGKAMDSFYSATPEFIVLAGSSKTSEQPIADAIEQLQKPASSLASKAEMKELGAAVSQGRFGLIYFSFVEYLKGAFSALAGMGMGGGAMSGIKSEGFLGAGLSVEGGALQIDAVATRSQIESIRKLFQSMRSAMPQGPQ